MRTSSRKNYTDEEKKYIIKLFNEGVKQKEIAELTRRTVGAIRMVIYEARKNNVDLKVGGVKVGEAPASSVEQPKPVGIIANGANRGMPVLEMTPRQMIKKLYDMGYRIENNHLVCYQKVVVKVNDIINGQ